MGLAQFKTEESYLDLRFIVDMVGNDFYTALTNLDFENCQDHDCDEELVNIISQLEIQKFPFVITFSPGVAATFWWTNRTFQDDTSLQQVRNRNAFYSKLNMWFVG